MRLPRASAEFATWRVTADDDVPAEVAFAPHGDPLPNPPRWHPAEWVDPWVNDTTPRRLRLRVRGPLADTADGVLLRVGTWAASMRFVAQTERPVRPAGTITVT